MKNFGSVDIPSKLPNLTPGKTMQSLGAFQCCIQYPLTLDCHKQIQIPWACRSSGRQNRAYPLALSCGSQGRIRSFQDMQIGTSWKTRNMAGLGRASSLTVNSYGVLSEICGGALDENVIWSGDIEGRHRRHMDRLIHFGVGIENDIHHRESVKGRWA